jgi:hypothetical protein
LKIIFAEFSSSENFIKDNFFKVFFNDSEFFSNFWTSFKLINSSILKLNSSSSIDITLLTSKFSGARR